MVCHSRAANFVLGLTEVQMNKDHDYGGVRDNQLRTLEHLGVFRVNWAEETQDRAARGGEGEGHERQGRSTPTSSKQTATRVPARAGALVAADVAAGEVSPAGRSLRREGRT